MLDGRCWMCGKFLTSGDINGVCRECAQKIYTNSTLYLSREWLEKRVLEIIPSNDDGDDISEVVVDFIIALRAQQERENPAPLTLEELKERVGKPVYIVEHEEKWDISEWFLCMTSDGKWFSFIQSNGHQIYRGCDYYGKTWTAYDHEPKGGKKG